MICSCGGYQVVRVVESVGLVVCTACDRGEFIPQAKPQDVFSFRSRVDLLQQKEA